VRGARFAQAAERLRPQPVASPLSDHIRGNTFSPARSAGAGFFVRFRTDPEQRVQPPVPPLTPLRSFSPRLTPPGSAPAGFFISGSTCRREHPLPHLGHPAGKQMEPKKCLVIGKFRGLYALPRLHMDTSAHLQAQVAR
jgi:hypothetical protein